MMLLLIYSTSFTACLSGGDNYVVFMEEMRFQWSVLDELTHLTMSGWAEPDELKVRADLVLAWDAQEQIGNNNCSAKWYVSWKFIFIALHIQQTVPINKFGFKGKTCWLSQSRGGPSEHLNNCLLNQRDSLFILETINGSTEKESITVLQSINFLSHFSSKIETDSQVLTHLLWCFVAFYCFTFLLTKTLSSGTLVHNLKMPSWHFAYKKIKSLWKDSINCSPNCM